MKQNEVLGSGRETLDLFFLQNVKLDFRNQHTFFFFCKTTYDVIFTGGSLEKDNSNKTKGSKKQQTRK